MKTKLVNLNRQPLTGSESQDIAIIGIGLRIPGSRTAEEFYANLMAGVDSVTEIPESRKKDILAYLCKTQQPLEDVRFGKAAYLDTITDFDYPFFGIAPKEAVSMDPSQRLFLEVAYEAIDDAGYADSLQGTNTGVYVAYNSQKGRDYEIFLTEMGFPINEVSFTGNLPPVIPGRLSYWMDLKGPSMIIDSACSSSLVAIMQAVGDLQMKRVDTAVVGGITINLLALDTNRKLGIESTDGLSRTFDELANGTGTGEGIVCIVLKPLSQALIDHDQVYAVIKGGAINQDGRSIGLSAPNPEAQKALLIEAWKNAGIRPQSLSFIEAHGTGTKMGDPIEIRGIRDAFEQYTDRKNFCAIGSVKTNIGHLDVTAGICGLVKAALSLRGKAVPPSLHFQYPNPDISFIDSPLFLLNSPLDLRHLPEPVLCGVSSFGFSGTNAHVVIEEFVSTVTTRESVGESADRPLYLLTVSSLSAEGLIQQKERYERYLQTHPGESIADICYTANQRRRHFAYRLAVCGSTAGELLTRMQSWHPDKAQHSDGVFYGKAVNRTSAPVDVMEIPFEPVLENAETLYALCRRYVQDLSFDAATFGRFFPVRDQRVVSLPAYAFQPIRCWPDSQEKKKLNWPLIKSYCWIETVYQSAPGSHQSICLIGSDTQMASLSRVLASDGHVVHTLELQSNIFMADDEVQKQLRLARPDEIVFICPSYINQEGQPSYDKTYAEKIYAVAGRFLSLIHAVSVYAGKAPLRFTVITKQAHLVTGREAYIDAQAAVIEGLHHGLSKETHNILCSCIDTDETTSPAVLGALITQRDRSFFTAVRVDKVYARMLDYLKDEGVHSTASTFTKDGVYLLTGGFGGIGLEILRYLTQTHTGIRVALLTKHTDITQYPEDKATAIQRVLEDFQQAGNSCSVYQTDVSNEEAVRRTLDRIRKQGYQIKGVLHAAGTIQIASLDKLDADALYKTAKAKINGLLWLDRYTTADSLDFFLTFGSAVTVFGMEGYGSYMAANAFMSAYAANKSLSGKSMVCVDWTGWSTGMGQAGEEREGLFATLTPRDALADFDILLKCALPSVFVGRFQKVAAPFVDYLLSQLPVRLSGEVAGELYSAEIPDYPPQSAKNAFGLLLGHSDNAYTKTETMLAGFMCQALGVDTVNINDDFFELGGNSLIALQIEMCLAEEGVKIDHADLYAYPTIGELAAYIDSQNLSTGAIPEEKGV